MWLLLLWWLLLLESPWFSNLAMSRSPSLYHTQAMVVDSGPLTLVWLPDRSGPSAPSHSFSYQLAPPPVLSPQCSHPRRACPHSLLSLLKQTSPAPWAQLFSSSRESWICVMIQPSPLIESISYKCLMETLKWRSCRNLRFAHLKPNPSSLPQPALPSEFSVFVKGVTVLQFIHVKICRAIY